MKYPYSMKKINMKYTIGENRMTDILHKVLTLEFEGFDDIYYNWADFNCGWGVCCDIYAIGFTLPKKDYDDYLFKLVDGEEYDPNGNYSEELTGELPEICMESPDIRDPRFNTYIFYDMFVEQLENYLGPHTNWDQALLELLNRTYRTEATKILFI